MNLYAVHAYDSEDEVDPVRTYIVTAQTEDDATSIVRQKGFAAQHLRLSVAIGSLETQVPGPQLLGWVNGARMLRAGGAN